MLFRPLFGDTSKTVGTMNTLPTDNAKNINILMITKIHLGKKFISNLPFVVCKLVIKFNKDQSILKLWHEN